MTHSTATALSGALRRVSLVRRIFSGDTLVRCPHHSLRHWTMGVFLQDMDSRTISTRLGTVRGQRRHVRLGDSGASRPTLEKRTTEHSQQHIGIDIRILISSGLLRGADLETLSHNISAMNAPNQLGYLKFTIYVLQTFVADGFMVRDSCIACSCVLDGLGRSIVLSWCGLVRGVRSRSHCSCTQAHLASPVYFDPVRLSFADLRGIQFSV